MTPTTSEDYRTRITRLVSELTDLKQAYELEQEENIRLVEEINQYSTALTKAQRRTKRTENECTELLLKLTDARNEVVKLKNLLDKIAQCKNIG